MKVIALAIILVALAYGGTLLLNNKTVYEQDTATSTPLQIIPEWVKGEDPDAIKAYQAVIKKKELEAELLILKDTFASSTEIYEAEKKAFTNRKIELEKEIGIF